jgi:hypothetical protein
MGRKKKRQQKKQERDERAALDAAADDEEGEDEEGDEDPPAPEPFPVGAAAPVATASPTAPPPTPAPAAVEPGAVEVVGTPVPAVAVADGNGKSLEPEAPPAGPLEWPRTLSQFLDEQLRLTNEYVFALIVAVVFCIYANTWQVPFLFDDAPVITRNRLFHELNFENAWKIFKDHPLRGIPNLTFYLNYHVQGTPAYQYATGDYQGTYGPTLTYHVFNWALHAVNGILLFLLLRTLLRGDVTRAVRATLARKQAQKPQVPEETSSTLAEWIALGATLLWLVHPIQTMAVTYIAQRYALFAAFGTFGSLLCYATLRRRMEAGTAWLPVHDYKIGELAISSSWLLYAGVWGFWITGCLSKENAAIVPWLIPVIELLCFTRTTAPGNASFLDDVFGDTWGRFALALSLLPGFFAALAYRASTVGLADLIPSSAPTFPDRMSYFQTEWVVVLKYLRLFVLPTDLSAEQAFPPLTWTTYDLNDQPVFHSEHATAMLIALVAHALIVALAIQWFRTGRKFLTLCVVWYYMTLAIESSIVPILDPMVEHRMYIPSAFLAAAVAYGVARIAGNVWLYGPDWTRGVAKRIAGSVTGAEDRIANALESVRTTIYERRHETAIGIVGAWCGLVVVFGVGTHFRNNAWGTIKDGTKIWRDVIEKRPDCARAYSSLGMEMLYQGHWLEAVEPIETALQLGPWHVEGWNNIGKAYLELGGAIKPMRDAKDPASPTRNILLEWARDTLMRGIVVNERAPSPSVPLCWNNLGLTYMKQAEQLPKGHEAEELDLERSAAKALAMAVQLDPGYDTAWINLGTCYVRQCEHTPRGPERKKLALEAVKSLEGSNAVRSPQHQLFGIAAMNLALACRFAEHHAQAFFYFDELYRRALQELSYALQSGDKNRQTEAQGQILSLLPYYGEEAVESCRALILLPREIQKDQETLQIAPPDVKQQLQDEIADHQGELTRAQALQKQGIFTQASQFFAKEAELMKVEPVRAAKLYKAAANLVWAGGGTLQQALGYYELAIKGLPEGEDRAQLEREKDALAGLQPPH